VAEVQKEVRKELTGLPYYGVFDLLTFQVSDQRVVTRTLLALDAALSELAALDEQQARIVELVGGRTSPLVAAVN